MTDLLEPPASSRPVELDASDGSPPNESVEIFAANWMLAALLTGAGAIHLAMAPSHLGASTAEGVGFIVAAWAQLALAVLAVVRPRRSVLTATFIVNGALIAIWLVSRTAGLPLGAHPGEAESMGLVDGTSVALEGAAIVVAALLLVAPARAFARSESVALIGAIGVLILATAAIASPDARDHAGSHGDGGDHAHEQSALGGAPGEHAADGHAHGDPAAIDDRGWSQLQNGQMGDHEHDHGDGAGSGDEEIDAQTAAELANLLALTAPLVQQYPTLGAAKAAGWWQAGPFAPGLGVHFSPPRYGGMNTDGVMDPEDMAHPTLIFDGITDDAKLAGFMYMIYQDTEPEGFPGPLDRWHYHTSVCIVVTDDGIRTPFGADLTGVTEDMCAAERGSFIDFTGYMVHVWTVPGYESELGTFSDLNPKITCPDGTYYNRPIAETGTAPTTCLNP